MNANTRERRGRVTRRMRHAGIGALAAVAVLSGCDVAGPQLEEPQTADARTPSVAHIWSEELLNGIRKDLARPTVHARNLFHVSSAMYDAWAIYSDEASTYLAGQVLNGFSCPMNGFSFDGDVHVAREQAISFAAYRMIRHRFQFSPGAATTLAAIEERMRVLGYDPTVTSTDYTTGSAAAVGNRIAECYIAYGLQDGANESNGYRNQFYQPVNPPLEPFKPGNPNMVDLDRWQQIALPVAIDQAGNPVNSTPPALSPEWGAVLPFALRDNERTGYFRQSFTFNVFHDPGPPPRAHGGWADMYKWNHALVAIWSGHLDQSDGVMIDISPASNGNTQALPVTFDEYPDFYDTLEGGVNHSGHPLNPATGQPYAPQRVPRGDYTRVLAEFWADGPTSETPPGHWYTIFNTITQHPALKRRLAGSGPDLGPLEWDVKGYFALGGAMHDVAICAWGIKGWYDSARPVSAVRAMADRGQSSDPNLPSYHPDGLPLYPGHIELIQAGDPLAGPNNENVGQVKLWAWRGPTVITSPATQQAGVGWTLAREWWPYQRPTFVTPPFPGYISGHSTYSRAAAEVLTELTGDAFFPGGMSQFEIRKNEFLVFEEGPSVDMTLQWATYRDAAEQSSLSRIWGGIHPPIDDVPGRRLGEKIGLAAFARANDFFEGR